MARLGLFLAIPFLTSQLCSSQQPAKSSEAALIGLHGPVHTVLTDATFAMAPKVLRRHNSMPWQY